jgi:hypothetical protein
MLRVFFRDERIENTPGNRKVRIIPNDAMLIAWIIEVAALVKKLDPFGQCHKAMRESGWNVDLVLAIGREPYADPPSERRRTEPDVHRDVQCFPLDDTAELGLRMLQLIMEPSQSSLRGPRMAILDEEIMDAEF